MIAADGNRIGVNEFAFREDGNRRRAAAHVDAGCTHFGFITDQSRQAACIRRCHDGFDRQMAAIDAKLEIAQRSGISRQHVHIDAKAVAQHALRVTYTALAVKRIADGQRVNEMTFCGQSLLRAGCENTANIGLLDLMTAEIDARGEGLALEATSRNIDDEAVDGQTGHAFCGIHCETDGLFGSIEIDDHAGLHTTRTLMADAQHFHAVRATWQERAAFMRAQPCNDAGHLA